MSAAVALKTGTTTSAAEAFRVIRAVHGDADERSVKVCEADATAEGPRLAASVLVSSQGVGAIIVTEVDGTASGTKRAAAVPVVHYAFYA